MTSPGFEPGSQALALYQLSRLGELLGQPMICLTLFPDVLSRAGLLVSSIFENEHLLGVKKVKSMTYSSQVSHTG